MRWNARIAQFVLLGTLLGAALPALVAVTAPAVHAQELSLEKKVELLSKNRGQTGSGDALRRFFFGDLMPLGVQPGGAGMVVNLYNKANDYTFSLCTTYDVVVALRKGKVAQFPASEVK